MIRTTRLNRPAGFFPTREEFGSLVRLALPVVVVQVGLMMMGVVDTIMVGRVSPQAIGSVALGNLYFFTVAVIGMGTLMALDPLVSQSVGAGDEVGVARGLQRGILLAAGLTVPACLLLLLIHPFLKATGQPAELIPGATQFAQLMIPGMLPFYLFIVFRQTLQALGRLAPIVWVTIGANLVNAVLDWVLIYGHAGAPALGVAGSAIATSISRWILALALLFAGWPELEPRLRPWRPESFDPGALSRMLRLGLPIGAQMWLEYGVFALVGALMGRIGTLAVAAHQIALNLSSIVFMVPLGVGAAAAVLVGQAIGAADLPRARRAAVGPLLVGGGFMVCVATVFMVVPGLLARLYTPDQGVLRIATRLIVLGGAFAIFDGLQAVCMGILRGIGDTRVPVVLCILGYWLIGLPASLLLGFRLGQGPTGLWWGLVLGLAATAGVLLLRVHSRLRRTLARILIDHPVGNPGEA
ncbi:MAG TPA: MATE family efflux transporter [Gemmatimonadales bacterium]|nr:MATE family efflux transporter [Gemmatimonadales bacterium]